MLIEYCYQPDQSTIAIDSVAYDEQWLKSQLEHYFSYWTGTRDACGVDIEDAWKCSRCDFQDVCEWRQKKAEEYAQKNRAAMAKT